MLLRFLCLVGPTGTGKSDLALRLAKNFGGGIVNADSRQVYRDFPLITAQPSPEMLRACPHELYGFLPTSQRLSAGLWAEKAIRSIHALLERGLLPILTGGTGFYLRALTDGIVDIPSVPPEIHSRLIDEAGRLGSEALHDRLTREDPAYAARIHPRDRQRVVRALEVLEATGKPFSWWHQQVSAPLNARILRLGLRLPLSELTPRLSERVKRMLAAGALEEAQAAFGCCSEEAPGWSGIGCRELFLHLRGEISREQALDLWIRHTRAYAKRQLTWFNADPRIRWFGPSEGDAALETARRWLQETSSEEDDET